LATLLNTEDYENVKVRDLVIGELYHINPDPRVYARVNHTGWLQIHKHSSASWGMDPSLSTCPKKIMVYLGRITSRIVTVEGHPVRETAHSFTMGADMVYIYGEHIRHVFPFTNPA
jgi:hypothetical protein